MSPHHEFEMSHTEYAVAGTVTVFGVRCRHEQALDTPDIIAELYGPLSRARKFLIANAAAVGNGPRLRI